MTIQELRQKVVEWLDGSTRVDNALRDILEDFIDWVEMEEIKDKQLGLKVK